MRTMITLILLLMLLTGQTGYAQKVLTISDCYAMAIKSSALAAEKDHYAGIKDLNSRNLSAGRLPTLDANASILYNSEVVDLSGVFAAAPIPGLAGALKPMPHEQYRITLDINQVIYDGGFVKMALAAEEAGFKVNTQQTETDLYRIRSQVNGIYFSLLLFEKQYELLSEYRALMEKKLDAMKSASENGIILKSDLDVLAAEKIKIEQQIAENEIKRNAMRLQLADLISSVVDNDTKLLIPDIEVNTSTEITRPEINLFTLRQSQLDAGMNLLQSKRMPKAFGFATLGYGNPPGNNFFRDEFAPYYIIGAGLKWNVFDWNRVKNEKQQMQIQKSVLEGRKTDLENNLRRSMDIKEAEIKSLEEALKRDRELIAINGRIRSTSESQYENGISTASELLSVLNAEKQAEINFEIHRINLALAKVEYLNICGKNIE